jgi:energy-coupling factor transporter ATP-binding protein EcfA2
VKSLVFRDLWILSKAEKAGIKLTLSPTVNLLLGENDVGKSTLIKSLYHCIGADTPQINNSVWKRASPIYCVRFEIEGRSYHIVRDEKYFGVFDDNKVLISRHIGVTGKDGIARFINGLLGFDIELERQADGKLGFAGPAFYFLPFYIDQDEGWSTSWTSFAGLRQFTNYRRLMIDYHLGVRPQSYYDARKREIELQEQLATVTLERGSMQAARNSVEKRKLRTQVDLDPAAFRAELEVVVDQYNAVYAQQQVVLSRLKEIRNQRNSVQTELQILRRSIAELEADYRYIEAPETLDVVGCPTCGTEFCNSFVERFGVLDDIDHCHALVDQWLKKHSEFTVQLKEVEDEYNHVSAQLQGVEATLARTKENVTLSELIASEGMKEMISSLNGDINELLDRERVIDDKIAVNAAGLKLDSPRKKAILSWYKARMKEFLNALNVNVLSEDDYNSLDKQIKNNALGSDLPRALLAQYFAFLSTMHEYGDFVQCPLLIDSPFQQEQDPTNRAAILNFILSKTNEGQQMILGTISVEEFADEAVLQNVTQHRLDNKLSVLSRDSYTVVLADIETMHSEALASPAAA